MSARRVVVVGRGGPEVLEVHEMEPPQPASGEVRLRVHRAGVAFGDVMRRRGVLVPPGRFTPGYDVVGVIDQVGASVDPERLGVRAAAMMPNPGHGGYATHACVPADRVVLVPDEVDDDTAICLGLNYITARQLLERFVALDEGDSVLVHGAAGGVGTAVLEIGALNGLRVFGTASAGKHPHVLDRGGIPIDYRSEDFVTRLLAETDGGADAVLDGIGGAEHLRRSHAAVKPGGTLVSFGILGGLDDGLWGLGRAMCAYAGLKVRPRGRKVRMYNITLSPGCSPLDCRDDWEALLAMAARGELAPKPGALVPLADVAEAHRLMDEAAVMGKVVLDCASSLHEES